MGFLQSYLRLPKYQRILLGLAGASLGWYGPRLMNYIFLSDAPSADDNVVDDKVVDKAVDHTSSKQS